MTLKLFALARVLVNAVVLVCFSSTTATAFLENGVLSKAPLPATAPLPGGRGGPRVRFDRVHLEVDTDPWGFIQTVTPEEYTDLTIGLSGEPLDFTITLDGVVPALPDDAIYTVTLNVYGDEATLLASEPLIIVVPGLY